MQEDYDKKAEGAAVTKEGKVLFARVSKQYDGRVGAETVLKELQAGDLTLAPR